MASSFWRCGGADKTVLVEDVDDTPDDVLTRLPAKQGEAC